MQKGEEVFWIVDGRSDNCEMLPCQAVSVRGRRDGRDGGAMGASTGAMGAMVARWALAQWARRTGVRAAAGKWLCGGGCGGGGGGVSSASRWGRCGKRVRRNVTDKKNTIQTIRERGVQIRRCAATRCVCT